MLKPMKKLSNPSEKILNQYEISTRLKILSGMQGLFFILKANIYNLGTINTSSIDIFKERCRRDQVWRTSSNISFASLNPSTTTFFSVHCLYFIAPAAVNLTLTHAQKAHSICGVARSHREKYQMSHINYRHSLIIFKPLIVSF